MKTRFSFVVLAGLLCCCYAIVSFAQGTKKGPGGKTNLPPGFCRNVELCLEELGVLNGNPDLDWEVQGNNMQAIPTGNVSVGSVPSPLIKFFTSDDDPNVQIAGAFFKRSSANQIGASIGLQGLSSDHRGRGTGVHGQASSNEQNANSVGVEGLALGGGTGNFGMKAEAVGNPTQLSVGIQAISTSNTVVQYGVQTNCGLSANATLFNAGIRSIGYGNDVTPNGGNYGLHVTAHPGTNTDTNIGVFTRAIRPPSNIPGNPTINYGIYACADGDGVNNLAGFFCGDVQITGSTFVASDAKLKLDIEPAESDALEMIQQLKPKKYTYRQDVPELALPEGTQYGFVAQELEQSFPHLVRESTRPAIVDDDGQVLIEEYQYKSANYVGLIPVLAQAIQEQQAQIEELKAELNELRKLLND